MPFKLNRDLLFNNKKSQSRVMHSCQGKLKIIISPFVWLSIQQGADARAEMRKPPQIVAEK